MRLRSLRLTNFRRYRDALLEFPDGIIAFVGPNGAGKSTLVEAVTWALFGHEAARTAKDLIKRDHAAPGEDAGVELEFELDGASYRVVRRMRGKTLQGDCRVEADGKLLVAPGANSSDQATAHLARLLGLDREAFHATVVAKQGDLNALSDRTSGARKRLVLGMLGVDDVEAAIRLVRQRKRESQVRLEELRRSLSRLDELKARHARLEAQHQEATNQMQSWNQESHRRDAEAERAAESATRLAADGQRHRELRGRLDGLQRGLEAVQAHRLRTGAELGLLAPKRNEWARLQAETARDEDLEERWNLLERARTDHEHRERLAVELTRTLEEQARWGAQLDGDGGAPAHADRPVENLSALRRRSESLAQKLARLEARALHIEAEQHRGQTEALLEQDRWRTLLEVGPEAPCPTCERPLGGAIHELAHRAAAHQENERLRLSGLRAEAERIRRNRARLEEERKSLVAQLGVQEKEQQVVVAHQTRARLAQHELERLGQARGVLEEQARAVPPSSWDPAAYDRLRTERAEASRRRQELARLEEALRREPHLREELALLAAEEERHRTEIMAASRDLGALGYAEGSAEAARGAWEAARAKAEEAQRERARLQERLAAVTTALDEVRSDLAHMELLGTQQRDAEDRLRIQEHLAADHGDRGLLPEFKTHLVARIRPALAQAAAQLVADMTGGRYADLEVDEEYDVRVYDGGTAWPLERFSGGETDVVNLALRLAVSQLVAHARGTSALQFVALDEVLANQDETRRRGVLAALQGLRAHFRQVLLVTHWDEVREGVDHVVRVEPAEDGTSRIWCSWTDAARPAEAPPVRVS